MIYFLKYLNDNILNLIGSIGVFQSNSLPRSWDPDNPVESK